MPNLNKVMLMGNLTRDPELKSTQSGTSVCNFGIATNKRWKTDNGEDREKTTFIDVTYWGRTAEVIAKHFQKGKPIYIEGELDLEQWEDKQSGQNRSKLSVVGRMFEFLGNREQGNQQSATQQQSSAAHDGADIPFRI